MNGKVDTQKLVKDLKHRLRLLSWRGPMVVDKGWSSLSVLIYFNMGDDLVMVSAHSRHKDWSAYVTRGPTNIQFHGNLTTVINS